MFSGIVQEIGIVEDLQYKEGLLEIKVKSSKLSSGLKKGNSIAIDGSCQTVVEVIQNLFKVQATEETLKKTNFQKLKIGSKVNLESSLKLGDKLDGHLVTGHIDFCGEISNIFLNGENTDVEIIFPKEFKKFIAKKGSVAVNGVSLTVVEVKNSEFTFSLIPYTRDNTNLGLLKTGNLVNLEVDLISRYLVNFLENCKEVVTT